MADPHAVSAACQYLGICVHSSADAAAWAAAIGSIGAAVVALGIATYGGLAQGRQRKREGKALAAYIAGDVARVRMGLLGAISLIRMKLRQNPIEWHKENLAPFAANYNAMLTGAVIQAKVDRFGLLPGEMGLELAAVAGSLEGLQSGISQFANSLQQLNLTQAQALFTPTLESLSRTLRDIERTHQYCERVTRPTTDWYDRIFHRWRT